MKIREALVYGMLVIFLVYLLIPAKLAPTLLIHDVRSSDARAVELIDFLNKNNISAMLLVIPEDIDGELAKKIREGNYIVLQHGTNHSFAKGYPHSDFYGLNYQQTHERLLEGKEKLLALGLYPVGYLAPGWIKTKNEALAVQRIYGTGNDFTLRIKVANVEYPFTCTYPICRYYSVHPSVPYFHDMEAVKQAILLKFGEKQGLNTGGN